MNLNAIAANPVLVEHTRGNLVESFHRGVICIVDEGGNTLYSAGNTEQVCFPRSALKLFQHIPLIVSGAFDHYQFTLKELAVMCGSHNGESMHVETVRGIFEKIGLDESYLQCGAQMPTLKADMMALIKGGKEPMAIHNNCSGKHAGFLAYCQFHSLPTETYLQESHPLHIAIKKATAKMYEINESQLVTGLDGCSAPIFAMPIQSQAMAYKNLVAPEKFEDQALTRACQLIVEAVSTYPEMLAGTKRYCSDLISATKAKVIGKTGADGVYSIAIPQRKIGICVKIDDGRMGPQYNVAQAILEVLDFLSSEEKAALRSYLINENKNFAGNITGVTRINSEMLQNIQVASTLINQKKGDGIPS